MAFYMTIIAIGGGYSALMHASVMSLKAFPEQGVKSVQVVCPGFSSDCLETIEEIGEENRAYFLEAGGERYEYIPALNTTEPHIAALTQLIQTQLQGWDMPEQNAGDITQQHYRNAQSINSL